MNKLATAFIIILVWMSITSGFIDRFKHPHLTETELFLRIPQSILLNFNHNE